MKGVSAYSAAQQEPLALRDVIAWLEGAACNTCTSPEWRAATELRRIVGWETVTLPITAPPAAPDMARDALRLDWLDEQWAATQKPGEAIKFLVDPTAGLELGECNIRDAIDAAMQSAQVTR